MTNNEAQTVKYIIDYDLVAPCANCNKQVINIKAEYEPTYVPRRYAHITSDDNGVYEISSPDCNAPYPLF